MARIRAPELPPNCDWLNSPPLSLRELRGRYVLLDFWTHGCINCIHVIPKLKQLAKRCPDLQIISVHTGKFDRENISTSVQQAIEKHAIHHPVVIDRQRKIWDNYAIRAYPTFVLVDPQGYIVLSRSGEAGVIAIAAAIADKLTTTQGPVDSSPPTDRATFSETPLRFPSKLIASDNRLFISDSGHHRIVVSSLPHNLHHHCGVVSELVTTIGQGQPGWIDGDYAQAQFQHPQGLALDTAANCLYIADTGNHAIRRIDLTHQQVTTIAGNGTQNPTLYPHGGKALEVSLNSPWDLVLVEQTLFIAMAGSHQIWQMDLARGNIQTFAGSGAEGCFDGTPNMAALAQPSGIASDAQSLFVADAESSSIRQVDLVTGATVTLCGSGNLYAFGDRDGLGETAQLQHPMGLAYADDTLWIADTYNHKIKRFDLKTGECSTIAAGFEEPTGVTVSHNQLLIADTNHHSIKQLDFPNAAPRPIGFPQLCAPGVCLTAID